MASPNGAQLGQILDNKYATLINRTGATLAKGDIVALDLTGSDGDVQTMTEYMADTTPDREAHPLANVIACASGNDDGWIYAVATESIADNASGKFQIAGLGEVNIATGISAGGRIAPPTSGDAAQAEADGLAVLGIALEANSSGSDAVKWCVFNGVAFSGPQAEV